MSSAGQTPKFVSPFAVRGQSTHSTGLAFVLLGPTELNSDSLPVELLHPEEQALRAAMRSEKRKQQFALGRIAAHQAIAIASGTPKHTPHAYPLSRNASGAVNWPSGYCGSITHSTAYAAAAAGSTELFSSLGIDLQQTAPFVRSPVGRRIADTTEQAWINHSPDPTAALACLFSAKEALYKALYPHGGHGLGFCDVRCHAVGSSGFRVELLKQSVATRFSGDLFVSTQIADGYALTGIAIARGELVAR